MPDDPADDEAFEAQVEQVVRMVGERGDLDAPPERVESVVREVLTELRRAKVKDFVALLAERTVRARLRQPPPS